MRRSLSSFRCLIGGYSNWAVLEPQLRQVTRLPMRVLSRRRQFVSCQSMLAIVSVERVHVVFWRGSRGASKHHNYVGTSWRPDPSLPCVRCTAPILIACQITRVTHLCLPNQNNSTQKQKDMTTMIKILYLLSMRIHTKERSELRLLTYI